MLSQVAYYSLLGKPLIMYLGILTLAVFIGAASIPILNKKRVKKISLTWHIRLAKIAIGLGIIHGILGLSLYI
jgi:hypothetical protein